MNEPTHLKKETRMEPVNVGPAVMAMPTGAAAPAAATVAPPTGTDDDEATETGAAEVRDAYEAAEPADRASGTAPAEGGGDLADD